MFRWFLVCTLLAAGTVTIMYLVFGPIQNPTAAISKETPPKPETSEKPTPSAAVVDDGGAIKPLTIVSMGPAGKGATASPTVIPGGRVYPVDTQEVPSERDGKLICIATEIKPGEVVPEDKKEKGVTFALLVIELNKAEKWTGPTYTIEGKVYRPLQEGEDIAPEKVKVHKVKRDLRILQVGEHVEPGQLLAIVNPSIPIDEVNSKVAKLDAAEADVRVSEKTKLEAEKRYASATQAYRGKAVSEDDWRAAKLAWDRYIEEERAKRMAVKQAQAEVQAALTTLKMCEVRASVPGIIRDIYKHPRGEAIKNLESILSIQSTKLLRVKAEVDIQVAEGLKAGMAVVIEAANPKRPLAQLSGHREAVTSVAVSKDAAHPLIVSSSEDRTLRVWARQGEQWTTRWEGWSNAVVRAIACTGPQAKQNLALLGAGDGSVHLLDLDLLSRGEDKAAARAMASRHPKAVNCVAFSPDGSLCATGDDDRAIYFWSTADGQLLATLKNAHGAKVTSLQFASPTELVSAGGDERLLVWDVKDPKNPKLTRHQFDHRGGAVTKLGVSPDGEHVLFDQGKQLLRMSLKTDQIDGFISNLSNDSASFSDMALFSPNGLCVLTNRPGEGRLQLWRTPTGNHRAEELRQYIWVGGAATCGAFAPDS